MLTEWTGLKIQTEPASEPITTTEVKSQSRIDGTDEDTLLARLITVARVDVEKITGRTLITQTWDAYYDSFPSGGAPIYLPNPPLQSISSITYVDNAGSTQTWSASNYAVDINSDIGRVYPAFDQSYPTVRNQRNAVTVRFVSGYGSSTTNVPETIRHAILLIVAELFERREEGIAGTTVNRALIASNNLLTPYTIFS
jgi:uncharacterized phiE125 gp8 family phage protein